MMLWDNFFSDIVKNNTYWAHVGPTCVVLGWFLFRLPRTKHMGPICVVLGWLPSGYWPEQHTLIPCGAHIHVCCSGVISIRIAQNNTYGAHMCCSGCLHYVGSLWAYPCGSHMGLHGTCCPYQYHMGPIWFIWGKCGADAARPILNPHKTRLAHMGPTRGRRCKKDMGPIWVLHGTYGAQMAI